MANHFILFDRPKSHDSLLPELAVVGDLPDYDSGTDYVGDLDVVNSVGRVTVEILQSTLPPGATLRVDNVQRKLVLKWPKYEEVLPTSKLVPNGGFEDGDDGTWTLGPGWTIAKNGSYNVETGEWSAKFADYKTKGSSIYGPRIPAKVNDSITFNARIQQGASSKGNAGARCHLIFRDAAGMELSAPSGPMVSSGSGGEWKDSGLTASAPGNTATVEVWIPAYRNKQNKPLFVDNVTWNHSYPIGQKGDGDYYLSLKVTDGLNRVAYWEGPIYERLNTYTSTLYPLSHDDILEFTARAELSVSDVQHPEGADRLDLGMVVPVFSITTMGDIERSVAEELPLSMAVPVFSITTFGKIPADRAERVDVSVAIAKFVTHEHVFPVPVSNSLALGMSITTFKVS